MLDMLVTPRDDPGARQVGIINHVGGAIKEHVPHAGPALDVAPLVN